MNQILAAMAGVVVLSNPASSLSQTQIPHNEAIERTLSADYPRLDGLYKHLHANPELSLQEEKTAARLAKELREAGYSVTEKVGGHGIVGVLKNGSGPTVMIRTDMDGLPVVEKTGLPYASKVRAKDSQGNDVGVMHACGHDVHMASWVGTARALASLKDRWSGSVVFVGQPAEEIIAGAPAMLKDGLFTRFPKPDYALALHVFPLEHGLVGLAEGPVLASADTVDITVHGKGGHGASPHQTIDPIVLAARTILDLQTLVSRETNPTEAAVVTVGSIHGGTKHNIIPNDVHLQLTVRSRNESVRQHLLDGIRRIARAAAMGARAPEPTIKIHAEQGAPMTINDSALNRKLTSLFQAALGKEKVVDFPPVMGAEDFAYYGKAGVPSYMYRLGMYAPERVRESEKEGGSPLPGNHNDAFAPVPEPTIKTGVLTMTLAALSLLGPPKSP